MSMQDISDKDLDKFFRNSAEEPNIPFDENAWTKMEQSLNRHHQKQRRTRYRNYTLLAFAVYLFSTVSVRTPEYSKNNASNSYITSVYPTNANTNKENRNTESYPAVDEKRRDEMSADPGIENDVQQSSTQRTVQEHTNKEKNTASNTTIQKQFNKESKKDKRTKGTNSQTFNRQSPVQTYDLGKSVAVLNHSKKVTRQAAWADERVEEKTIEGNQTSTSVTENSIAYSETDRSVNSIATNETINNDHNNHIEQTQNKQIENTAENTPVINSPVLLAADSTEKMLPIDSLQPVAAERTKDSTQKKDDTSLRRRFSFGLFASPDYSYTASNQLVSPGLTLGVFAEYHINKRWTIFAGVMRSSKIYSSNGSDYTATDRYWAYKGYTNRIDGSCAVIDVPLNVKYHFYNRNKNLLFASTGLSSYFMLHEEYRFVYNNSYYADRSWSYDTKRNYFFGIVNLSVGYERYISKHFSVQVEPFIKIPLGTIGDGQVKLTTTGMFFYLKYSIH